MKNKELIERIERGILEQFYDKMHYELHAEMREAKVDYNDDYSSGVQRWSS